MRAKPRAGDAGIRRQYDKLERVQIYLLRHGIAEEGGDGTPDSERAITQEGKKKLREVLND